MHAHVSLSRPVPPPLPRLARHPLDLDPLDFRRPFASAASAASPIGDPPAALCRSHRPAVLNDVLTTWRARLREPVSIVPGTATKVPMLCALLSFHADPD